MSVTITTEIVSGRKAQQAPRENILANGVEIGYVLDKCSTLNDGAPVYWYCGYVGGQQLPKRDTWYEAARDVVRTGVR